MSVQTDNRSRAPLWKVVLTFIFVTVVGVYAAVVKNGEWWAVAVGIAILTGGAVLFVQSCRRTLRENHGQRIPWIGVPPVNPRTFDLMRGIGAPLVMLGALSIGQNTSVPWGLLIPVIGCVLISVTVAVFARHNRRVRAMTNS